MSEAQSEGALSGGDHRTAAATGTRPVEHPETDSAVAPGKHWGAVLDARRRNAAGRANGMHTALHGKAKTSTSRSGHRCATGREPRGRGPKSRHWNGRSETPEEQSPCPSKGAEEQRSWSQAWTFDEQGEGRIDLVELHEGTPWQPAPGRIEEIELLLEPTAAILFGKLWRSHLALARDAFDLGVAGELDQGALNEALQVLGKARTEQAEEHIRRAQLELEVEAQTELKGVVELWEDFAASPAQAALKAIKGCWKETEKAQLSAIANETERMARRIRRIQLEQGTGQITVNAKRSGLEIIWSEPGEGNHLVVAENVSNDDWTRSWASLRATPKANVLEYQNEEDTKAVERA